MSYRSVPRSAPQSPEPPSAPAVVAALTSAGSATVPAEVRALLGPSWLIAGADPDLYERLLAQVGAAVRPIDIVDWLLLKDVVALTWEIQRSRRHRDSLIRMGRGKAMAAILEVAMPSLGTLGDFERDEEHRQLVAQWLNGDTMATKRIEAALAATGFSFDDVAAQSLTVQAAQLSRIDQNVERHEARRDGLLQQIERRRAGWSARVQRASEDIVDAEAES
jgi:hypothetical protein